MVWGDRFLDIYGYTHAQSDHFNVIELNESNIKDTS